ncbi:MAG: hypothetical protein KGN84_19405 [Acidobacteriota bacterium]|nr:hypothetical protein [Acidobacteriota bacterium]
MNGRFLAALIAYAVLLGLASLFLSGMFLKGVLILFAGLVAKTAIAWAARR